MLPNETSRPFSDALQTAVETAEVDKLELLSIPTSISQTTVAIVPRTIPIPSSSAPIVQTSGHQTPIFESISSLPPHFQAASSSHLSQGRINPNTIHGTSSGPVFEHSDPRLLHGDAYLQPISTPISTPHSGGQPGGVHVISSSVSGSNPSLYSGLVGRGIDDNGMDSPTYIQLESSSGAVLPPGGRYSPAGNAIYSATPISLSGGSIVGNLGHKPPIEYSDVPLDPSMYAIKSNPSTHR